MTLRTPALYLLALLLLGACVPGPEEEIVAYPGDTTMGRIQRRDVLVVGIQDGAPPISSGDDGFVLAYARFIAESLGVEAVRVETGSPDELLGRVEDGGIDVAFPLVPLTERLVRQNTFTDPYLVSHQRLLVPRGSPLEGVEDLAGRRVCSFLDKDVGVSLDAIEGSIEVVEAAAIDECRRMLESGDVDAITASEIWLVHLARDMGEARIAGEQLTTEGYAAAVNLGDSEMAGFVSATLDEYKSEGHWLTDYQRLVAGPLDIEGARAPDLTLEEAATLFPKDVPAG